ncbi:MAG TPA: DUF4215 domain-containing protein [Polyangiaceae bacterium]|nr:DUF4215 domain-containing protein [Polyangiaceae bacterium]
MRSVVNMFLVSSLIATLSACAGPNGEPDFELAGDGGGDSDDIDAVDITTVSIDGAGGSDATPKNNAGTKFEAPTGELDACGGLPLDIHLNTPLTFSATTIGGHDDFKTWCGDTSAETAAPDVVYAITAKDACVLTVTVTDSSPTFDPVLEIRQTACDSSHGGDACSNARPNVESASFYTEANVTYWAIIDGSSLGDAGDYTLAVDCQAPACGDRVVTSGELCDDGNTTDGDGCSSTCQLEGDTTAPDSCADLADGLSAISIASATTMGLPGVEPLYVNGGAGVNDDAIGSCAPETGGLDQVFDIVPTASGTMTARVGFDLSGTNTAFCQPPDYDQAGCRDHTLFVRENDCSSIGDIACQLSNGNDLTNVLSFPVVAGNHYYVFVDGYDGEWYSTGEYNLEISLD